MVETVKVVDGDPKMNGPDQVKRKRKRASAAVDSFSTEQKEVQIKALNQEIEGLFGYYREMMDQRLDLESALSEGNSVNTVVAALMEESRLPLSKLVGEVYGKVQEKAGNLTLAAVKSAVLFVGQRVMYGVPNPDADVLEDDTDSCLWCWETRDVKLMPISMRGVLKIRRTCRKKIHERIAAVSAMIAALERAESHQLYKHDIMKESEKLGRVLSEADIRLLVDNMLRKSSADMADKEAKREEKMWIKQLERNKREAEKEKKRMDREILKEKWQSEKEQKRMQLEDEKRREKEESEMRKQLRKQQDDAEKDQRRREKEEAELKKQLAVQKQASIMERFLKRNKTISVNQNDQSSSEATTASDSSNKKRDSTTEAVTKSIDCALSSTSEIKIDDIRKSLLFSWQQLGHSIRSNPNQHWGVRKKPKTELFKELKLSNNGGNTRDDELNVEKLVDGVTDKCSDDRICITYSQSLLADVKKCNQRKQLLQFDKSHRPAFYGIWPKKSQVIGPRHPLRKDPDLDYDIDSDEEWEEEEPGESLSDCDKDEEEGSLEEGCSKADDEDESEDDFFVPDGYLSENEGVQVDRMETDSLDAKNLPNREQYLENEEFCAMLRQQKHLYSLTEHALRKNQPLIILNLMHEKASLLVAEDLSGNPKLEKTCLQALSIRVFPGGHSVLPSIDSMQDEDQACLSNGKGSTTPVSTIKTIPDSDLPAIVSVIQSCTQGINKVVESLQQKFPDIPKSQLRNKVREISDFADNHWQVKKDILVKHGLSMSPSPDKSGGGARSIATFFSKRCLPPSCKRINPTETSPHPSLKPEYTAKEQHGCTSDHV